MPYPAQVSPQTILEAALELLESEGQSALSMRQLAEKLGVKAPSLYRHYADKETLEQALSVQAAVLLHGQLEQAGQTNNGFNAVMEAGKLYLEFARQHPQLYSLLTEKVGLPSTPGAGKDLWNLVLKLIGKVTGNPDDTAAAVALWSLLHGFAVLERSGMFGHSGPKGGFERGLRALLEGLIAPTVSS